MNLSLKDKKQILIESIKQNGLQKVQGLEEIKIDYMKNIFFILFALLISVKSSQAIEIDTSTFEVQRAKVNALLNERTQKFGAFDTSLSKKTGIFGLFKTNADMQKSIDILKEIIQHDNKIFKETRKLLTIKDAHAVRYQQLANQYDDQVTAYMKTISKLQAENEKLRSHHNELKNEDRSDNIIIFALSLSLLGLLFIVYKQYTYIKSKKLT